MIFMLFLYAFPTCFPYINLFGNFFFFCPPRSSLKNNLFAVTRLMILRMGRSVGKFFFLSAGIEKKKS